ERSSDTVSPSKVRLHPVGESGVTTSLPHPQQHLCAAVATTDEGFSYTNRGELATFFESTPHSSGYYTITSTYWDNGKLKTMSGVSLPTLNYNVDAMGRTTTVTTSGADPVTATTYDIASRATAVTFGSG